MLGVVGVVLLASVWLNEPTAGPDAGAPHDAEPASRAASRVLAKLEAIEARLETTKYQHRRVVRWREGYFAWDCSSMVTWVLERTAPKAREAIERERPVAVSYVRAIERAPTQRYRDGWQQVDDIRDVRPGDIFAWRRPPDYPSKNTGHVGFVVGPPTEVEGIPGAFKVRIADASSYRHEDDTRPRDGEGGYGRGTILFAADARGHVWAYGWFGDPRYIIEAEVVFGRVRG